MAIDDGGQVFPTTEKIGELAKTSRGGLTVRQLYAGIVLAGLVQGYAQPNARATELAETALCLADAMIQAEKVDG